MHLTLRGHLAMSRIAHLSDLHFGRDDRLQPVILDGLISALADQKIDLLVLTGDVFDSSTTDPSMIERFMAFFERLDRELRGVRTLILPGNHDRRDQGVFSPWSGELFERLARRLTLFRHVTVLGLDAPFLGKLIDVPGIAADIACYDSTYLPRGFVTAGGLIRQVDLINLADQLRTRSNDRPVLFLLHHHLIPTPVTDTSLIGLEGRPWWQKYLVGQVLPDLIGNGDREELTMTALGAGTALSTLQQLGRAVIVLHGHKHYPTARLLKGLEADEGDLLIASAGSCGTATVFTDGDFDESPRLWPSLNILDHTDDGIDVQQLAWSPYEPSRVNPLKPLISAARDALSWSVRRPTVSAQPFDATLALNEARFEVRPSSQFFERQDLVVHRRVKATPSAYMKEYWEVVSGPPGARVAQLRFDGLPLDDATVPARVRIPLDGVSQWVVQGGAVTSAGEAERRYGPGTAYEFVQLLNRSRCELATLSVDLGPIQAVPFASATDLTSGKERPISLQRKGQRVWCVYPQCPARMLLRISWPLTVG